jgi:hypothetical protein
MCEGAVCSRKRLVDKKIKKYFKYEPIFYVNNTWDFPLNIQRALCNTLILMLRTYCKIYEFQQKARIGDAF